MKTGKVILRGCGVVAGLLFILMLGGGVAVYHMSQDPVGMAVFLESPEKVKKGEQFDLRVIVVNERKDKPLTVESIDIDALYLEGVSVRNSDPASRSSSQLPMEGGRSYVFDQTVPAGQTNVFTFHLRARDTGTFSGDVDVCEGWRFLTRVAETEVTEEAEETEAK